MTLQPLQLPRRLAIRLLHEAQVAGERRVCGLIGGRNGEPVVVHPLPNCTAAADGLLHLDSADLAAALQRLQEQSLQPLALYHSLPAAPAAPADFRDLALPYELIVSLSTKGVLNLRCWKRAGDGLHECEVQIRENS